MPRIGKLRQTVRDFPLHAIFPIPLTCRLHRFRVTIRAYFEVTVAGGKFCGVVRTDDTGARSTQLPKIVLCCCKYAARHVAAGACRPDPVGKRRADPSMTASAAWLRPRIHNHDRGYGFRARDCVPPRNDGGASSPHERSDMRGETIAFAGQAAALWPAHTRKFAYPLVAPVSDNVPAIKPGPARASRDRSMNGRVPFRARP